MASKAVNPNSADDESNNDKVADCPISHPCYQADLSGSLSMLAAFDEELALSEDGAGRAALLGLRTRFEALYVRRFGPHWKAMILPPTGTACGEEKK